MMREDYSSQNDAYTNPYSAAPDENCRPRAAPRCGLSFTIRALTATRRLAPDSIGNLTTITARSTAIAAPENGRGECQIRVELSH